MFRRFINFDFVFLCKEEENWDKRKQCQNRKELCQKSLIQARAVLKLEENVQVAVIAFEHERIRNGAQKKDTDNTRKDCTNIFPEHLENGAGPENEAAKKHKEA